MSKRHVVGIDEVGRGPLAGPVAVAALAAPASLKFKVKGAGFFKEIKDSKKLSAKKREEWFLRIKKNRNLKYAVSFVSPSVIDKRGISFALRLAVKRCLEKLLSAHKLKIINYKLFLDGSLVAPPEYSQKTIIKGDEKISIIAAASIIAKVTRDRRMVSLSKKFPDYSFEIHKGYGTRLHCELIRKHGLSEIHRQSFCTRLI